MVYIILTIIAAVLFISYLVYCLCTIKYIPESVSQTYYLIPKGFLLTIIYFLLAILMLPPLLETTPEDWKIVAFLFPSCIAMVGVCADYGKKFILIPHMIFTWISIICAVLWTIFCTPYWYIMVGALVLFTVVGLITKTLKSSVSWWLEIALFLSIFVELLLILFLK